MTTRELESINTSHNNKTVYTKNYLEPLAKQLDRNIATLEYLTTFTRYGIEECVVIAYRGGHRITVPTTANSNAATSIAVIKAICY